MEHPKILKVSNESIDYLPLTVSQATAMEINDRNTVQGCLKLPNSNVPLNDGTNGCAFLAIGVIDNCSSLSIFDPNILTNEITLTITEFPKKFNPHRNVQECVDIYEAYSILNCNNLLEHTFKLLVLGLFRVFDTPAPAHNNYTLFSTRERKEKGKMWKRNCI